MDMNDRINKLIAENAMLQRRIANCRPAWSALLIAYIIGFILGVLYAR